MSRRVFFSFHYRDDIFRVNVVRNSGVVIGTAAAGFQDASLWEKTKRKGATAVKRLIDRGLDGTSVTCVLIGQRTAHRRYVNYEIEQSIRRCNGLLGIRIHGIKDIKGRSDFWPGEVPMALEKHGAPVYDWDQSSFGKWVEEAYQRARRRPSRKFFDEIASWFR